MNDGGWGAGGAVGKEGAGYTERSYLHVTLIPEYTLVITMYKYNDCINGRGKQ